MVYKNEIFFRHMLYIFYQGNSYYCNVCDKGLRSFIIQKDDKLCPNCGSLSRTRRLWDLMQSEFLKKDISILDFSPSRSFYRKLKNQKNISYFSTDLSGDFIADYQYNITQIDSKDSTFDLIICFHVLEHIENDGKAMAELFRVLRTGGKCIIQTPFKEGDIYEDFSLTTEAERLYHFGQIDHVRIYSINGLSQRLMEHGFRVEVRKFFPNADNRNGFHPNENILICSKD